MAVKYILLTQMAGGGLTSIPSGSGDRPSWRCGGGLLMAEAAPRAWRMCHVSLDNVETERVTFISQMHNDCYLYFVCRVAR